MFVIIDSYPANVALLDRLVYVFGPIGVCLLVYLVGPIGLCLLVYVVGPIGVCRLVYVAGRIGACHSLLANLPIAKVSPKIESHSEHRL